MTLAETEGYAPGSDPTIRFSHYVTGDRETGVCTVHFRKKIYYLTIITCQLQSKLAVTAFKMSVKNRVRWYPRWGHQSKCSQIVRSECKRSEASYAWWKPEMRYHLNIGSVITQGLVSNLSTNLSTVP